MDDGDKAKNLLLNQDVKKIRAFLGNRNILVAFHVEDEKKDLKALKSLRKYLTSESKFFTYKSRIEKIASPENKSFILLNIIYDWDGDFNGGFRTCKSKWDIYEKLMNGE